MRRKDLSAAVVLVLAVVFAGFAQAGCPGCCSSHGGVSYTCAANGRVYCNDGTVSPSCSCSSCGVASTPTCPSGQSWNGSQCVSSTPECGYLPPYPGTTCLCTGGRVWVNGSCECTGGRQWLQSRCQCLASETWAATEGKCHKPAAASACGVERWAIKTGGDPGASGVSDFPQVTSVDILTAIPAPADVSSATRIDPVENGTYALDATLSEYRLTEDSDYHLVLKSPNNASMIVEIPHPDCVAASSPYLEDIKAARTAFDQAFAATTSFKSTSTAVRVSGVGFWDDIHGQRGVARNGIELHPVRSFETNPTGALAVIPLDGLWVIDAENNGRSGRGFQLETHGGQTVMTYYGYRPSGDGQWYLASGPLSSGQFSGSMDGYQGGTTFGGSFVPAAKASGAGQVALRFSSATTGTMTLPGEPSRSISKFFFSGGGTPSVAPLNGLWAIDSENNGQPGRGFQIEERGGLLVLTFYGYGGSGTATWYLAAGTLTGNTFTGELMGYRGGTVVGGTYAPANQSGSAGTVVLTFSGSSKGTITLPGETPKAISKFSW